MKNIVFIVRVILGAVFIYSGWQKLMAPMEEFRAVVAQYAFLPKPAVPWTAFLVPWLELVLGTFVLLGFMTRKAVSVLAVMLAAFVILLVRSLVLHLEIAECGCFGSGIMLQPKQAILLDAWLFLLSVMVIWRKKHVLSLDAVLNK